MSRNLGTCVHSLNTPALGRVRRAPYMWRVAPGTDALGVELARDHEVSRAYARRALAGYGGGRGAEESDDYLTERVSLPVDYSTSTSMWSC